MRSLRALIAVGGMSCLLGMGPCAAQGSVDPADQPQQNTIKAKPSGNAGKRNSGQLNSPTEAEQENPKYQGILINPKILRNY